MKYIATVVVTAKIETEVDADNIDAALKSAHKIAENDSFIDECASVLEEEEMVVGIRES